MHGFLSTFAIALVSTVALGVSIPIETALARRVALPSTPTDFHSTTRPRRVRKHDQSRKRSSAASDRAKRTPSPAPVLTEHEERQLDLLDAGLLDGLLGGATGGGGGAGGLLGKRQIPSLPTGALPLGSLGGLGLLDLTSLLTSASSGMSTHQAKISASSSIELRGSALIPDSPLQRSSPVVQRTTRTPQ